MSDAPRNGFTLAELLISLAILGVIATFAIPKVLDAQQDQRKKAIFRETIAAVSEAYYNGRLLGQFDHDSAIAYFASRMNAVKLCPTNVRTEGCSTYGSAWPGYVLHNGAIIRHHLGGQDDIYIDWNGDTGPNVDGDDILPVFGVDGPEASWCAIKKNTVGFPHDACSGTWPSYAAWKTLYEWVFSP